MKKETERLGLWAMTDFDGTETLKWSYLLSPSDRDRDLITIE